MTIEEEWERLEALGYRVSYKLITADSTDNTPTLVVRTGEDDRAE